MNVWASLGLMANPSFKRMEMVISNHFPSKDLDHQVKIWIIMVVRVPSMYYIWLQNARPEPIPDTNPKKNMNIIEHQRTTFLESNKLGDPSFRPNKNNFGSLYPRNRPWIVIDAEGQIMELVCFWKRQVLSDVLKIKSKSPWKKGHTPKIAS